MKDHTPSAPPLAKSKANLSVTFSTSQGARDYQEDAFGHWFDGKNERLFAVVADGAGAF
jgi:serine/threonine protein phosphatase PrpC